MTRQEHLLCILAEECAEVAQRVSKALRFTLDEVQPGQEATNAERIVGEMTDLIAVYEMLVGEGILRQWQGRRELQAKRDKIEKFLIYSASCGTVQA